jgi:hypothetical protein
LTLQTRNWYSREHPQQPQQVTTSSVRRTAADARDYGTTNGRKINYGRGSPVQELLRARLAGTWPRLQQHRKTLGCKPNAPSSEMNRVDFGRTMHGTPQKSTWLPTATHPQELQSTSFVAPTSQASSLTSVHSPGTVVREPPASQLATSAVQLFPYLREVATKQSYDSRNKRRAYVTPSEPHTGAYILLQRRSQLHTAPAAVSSHVAPKPHRTVSQLQ